MRKFLCKTDFVIMGKKLALAGDSVNEGDILQSNDNTLSLKMDIDTLLNNASFEEVVEVAMLDIKIQELPEEEEDIEKDWVLQIKVTTSRKKLRTIERYIREDLVKLL
jgi:hypothetical protein